MDPRAKLGSRIGRNEERARAVSKFKWPFTARGRAAIRKMWTWRKPPGTLGTGAVGMCLDAVHTANNIPAKYPDAKGAAEAAKAAGDLVYMPPAKVPKGYPIFFKVGEHWHVAESTGRGWCRSTDIMRYGFTNRVRINTISIKWKAEFLGVSKSLNGVKIA